MKYPCWSDYDSVYDGVELEIHIVDHCNLNCAGCNHFCPLAEPFYISLKDFQEQLELVKEKIPSLKWLMLLGGEPTLHPQLLELCQIARAIFPNITIEVLTNGKDLSQVIKQKEDFEKINIVFTIARYNIPYDEKKLSIIANMKNSGFSWSRENFTQTLVDITGSQDINKSFYQTCHHQLPCFTIQDYKIFECPFAAHIRHFNKKFHTDIQLIEDKDYLNLNTLTLDKLETFAYKPKNICKYCKPGDHWIWHLSDKSFDEYTKTMLELYFTNYSKYEYIKTLKPNIMSSSVDPNFGLNITQENKIRTNGKLDIIIPYYILTSEQIDILLTNLNNQTIIKDCMIYLISDNSPNEEELIYQSKTFKDLHIIFLKNEIRSGPGVARNKGINLSLNKYLFFLDSDDFLYDPLTLEKAYNLISQANYDVITLNRQTEDYQLLKQFDYLCSRNFLNFYNIRFGEYYIHEDLFFTYQLKLYHAKICYSSFNGVIYNRYNKFNLSSKIPTTDVILNKYFTLYKICELSLLNSNIDFIQIEKYLNEFANIQLLVEKEMLINIKDNPELIENIYFILLKSLNLIKEKITLEHLDPLLILLLSDSFNIYGSSIFNYETLIQKVKQNFKKYQNDIFLQQIIIELGRN